MLSYIIDLKHFEKSGEDLLSLRRECRTRYNSPASPLPHRVVANTHCVETTTTFSSMDTPKPGKGRFFEADSKKSTSSEMVNLAKGIGPNLLCKQLWNGLGLLAFSWGLVLHYFLKF